MWIKRIGVALAAIGITAWMAGCNGTHPKPGAKTGESGLETVARVHWMGKKNLASNPTATNLMSIWNLPESARLEAQTVGKLAVAPWLVSRGPGGTNGAPSTLLQPLVQDLVDLETYLEIRGASNQTGELVLAVKVEANRARTWETNLAQVMESLTGVKAAVTPDGGWTLKKHDVPNLVQAGYKGEWFLVGLAQEKNNLFKDVVTRIKGNKPPFESATKTNWLQADIDFRKVAHALGRDCRLPQNWPAFSVAVTGDGENVRTKATARFPSSLGLSLPDWSIPTGLVSEPLASFTAMRGLRALLASLEFFPVPTRWPDQLYIWTLDGLPFEVYAAAPDKQASNTVSQVSRQLQDQGNPWLLAKAAGIFESSTNEHAVLWKGLPLLSPFVTCKTDKGQDYLFAGLIPLLRTNQPPPAELFSQLREPKAVFYDWELTGPRIAAGLYSGQLVRLVFRAGQLPPESKAVAWLKALESRLGNCATLISHTAPNELSLTRKSMIGLNSWEIHLMADWLESGSFPVGLNSTQTKAIARKNPVVPATKN